MGRKNREYTYEDWKKAMDLYYKYKLRPTKISRILEINKNTIRGWLYYGKIPYMAKWHLEPNEELAYTIGAINDGCITKNEPRGQYRIIFKVIDKKFGEVFSRAMSRVLGVNYHKPRWNKKEGKWEVIYYSKAFYEWYKRTEEQGLEGFKPFIEHSKNTVTAFLRGLYDAEGYNYGCRLIFLSNNNIKLLRYVQYLLKRYFGIATTGPYLSKKVGSMRNWNGRKIVTRHNNYYIAIYRKKDVQRFLNEVGFTITRKQLGLKKKELVKQGFFRPPFSDTQ